MKFTRSLHAGGDRTGRTAAEAEQTCVLNHLHFLVDERLQAKTVILDLFLPTSQSTNGWQRFSFRLLFSQQKIACFFEIIRSDQMISAAGVLVLAGQAKSKGQIWG
jgi:hypothetical protein